MGTGPVRNPRRDDHGHPGAHDPEVAGEIELELPLDHDGNLLLLVGVDGGRGVGVVPNEAGHELATDHRAEHQPGDELQCRHVLVDLDVGASGRAFPQLGIHREVSVSVGHLCSAPYGSSEEGRQPAHPLGDHFVVDPAEGQPEIVSAPAIREEGGPGDESYPLGHRPLGELHGIDAVGQGQPTEESSPRPGPGDPFGHVCLEGLDEERASPAIQRPAPGILLLEKPLPAVLLEKPLTQGAGALIGVLLG